MERKFYTDNFEQLLKEKSDEFRMYPSKRVWHSIYNDLHPGRKWPSVAISMLLVIALLMVGYWNNNSSQTKTGSASGNSSANGVAPNGNQSQSDIAFTSGKAANIAEKTTAVNNVGAIVSHGSTVPQNKSTAALQPGIALAAGNITKHASQKASTHRMIIGLPANANNSAKSTPSGNPDQSVFNQMSDHKKNADEDINSIVKTNGSLQQNTTSATVSGNISSINTALTEAITSNKTIAGNNDEVIALNENDATKIITPDPTNSNNISLITSNSTAGKEQGNDDNKGSKIAVSNKKAADKKSISIDDRAWMEDYAFHNKSKRKKWQDRSSLEFYITPSVGYRRLSNDSKYNVPGSTPAFAAPSLGVDASAAVNQKPDLGFEAGLSVNYSIAKNLRVKAGVQANYTNYGINANEINHPTLTTLLFLDPNTGYAYMHAAPTTLSTLPGSQTVKVHNTTYQVSIPVGFALKLSGNNKLEWYTGATIQPTFVVGGKAYLVSADRKNYVVDNSLIGKWNLNAAIETYINYKFDGFTLQAGPQFRTQLLSTYYKRYTVKETLYNIGLKIGIVKNF